MIVAALHVDHSVHNIGLSKAEGEKYRTSRGCTKAAAVQAQHEQELRKLLTQAQDDIEKHRKLAAAAQREKQVFMDQVSGDCTITGK